MYIYIQRIKKALASDFKIHPRQDVRRASRSSRRPQKEGWKPRYAWECKQRTSCEYLAIWQETGAWDSLGETIGINMD